MLSPRVFSRGDFFIPRQTTSSLRGVAVAFLSVVARALPVAILPPFTLPPPSTMRVLFLIPVNVGVFVILSGAERSRRIWQEQRYYHPDYQILRYAQNDNVGVRNDREGVQNDKVGVRNDKEGMI